MPARLSSARGRHSLATSLLIPVSLLHLASTLPIAVVSVVEAVHKIKHRGDRALSEQIQTLGSFLVMLMYLNNGLNCLVYFVSSQRFRSHFLALLRGQKQRPRRAATRVLSAAQQPASASASHAAAAAAASSSALYLCPPYSSASNAPSHCSSPDSLLLGRRPLKTNVNVNLNFSLNFSVTAANANATTHAKTNVQATELKQHALVSASASASASCPCVHPAHNNLRHEAPL